MKKIENIKKELKALYDYYGDDWQDCPSWDHERIEELEMLLVGLKK